MPVTAQWQSFDGTAGGCRAYIASMEPVAEPRPAVIVIQEIWGVEAHIQDVAQRIAAAGYVAIAPDLFAENGVRPDTLAEERLADAKAFLHSLPHSSWHSPEEREKELAKLPADRQNLLRPALQAIFELLQPAKHQALIDMLTSTADFARNSFDKTKGMPVTSIGFCLGGALSCALATRDPKHAGSIIFYGRPPKQGIENIQCPVLGFYGGEDPNITNLIPAFEEEMRAHGKTFEAITYAGAKHAFFNDSNPTYNVTYARDAFARSLQFLNQTTKQ